MRGEVTVWAVIPYMDMAFRRIEMWQEKTRGYSSGSFALHIPCAVPAMIVSSKSPNVSKSASNCRRNVDFSAGDSGCMYWSTDMWNIVTS